MENGFNQRRLSSSKTCEGMTYWLHKKWEIKGNATFEKLEFMRAFYDSSKQVDSIFSWKVILLK